MVVRVEMRLFTSHVVHLSRGLPRFHGPQGDQLTAAAVAPPPLRHGVGSRFDLTGAERLSRRLDCGG